MEEKSREFAEKGNEIGFPAAAAGKMFLSPGQLGEKIPLVSQVLFNGRE